MQKKKDSRKPWFSGMLTNFNTGSTRCAFLLFTNISLMRCRMLPPNNESTDVTSSGTTEHAPFPQTPLTCKTWVQTIEWDKTQHVHDDTEAEEVTLMGRKTKDIERRVERRMEDMERRVEDMEGRVKDMRRRMEDMERKLERRMEDMERQWRRG